MSGAQTIPTPRGLDALDASDLALIDSMRDDDGGADADLGPEPSRQQPPAEPAATEPETHDDFEVEIDEAPPVDNSRAKTVPHAQFHAINERRKVAETKAAAAEAKAAETLATLERERAVLQARVGMLASLAEAQSTPAPVVPVAASAPEPELPDVHTDPIEHFRALAERQQRVAAQERAAREDLAGIVRGMQEQQQRAQQVAEMRGWAAVQERQFMAREPTYDAAMNWLRQNRHEELEAIGITDSARRDQIINNDVSEIAHLARREGANFPERLFKAAQKRGFVQAAPPPPPATAAAPVIPPLDAEIDPAVAARATAAETARYNATTLSGVGAAPPARLSVARLADMSEAQFAAFYGSIKDNPAKMREVFGS